MFSPLGGPGREEGDIDWIDDLKVFIDNENEVLSKVMFPAIRKHNKYRNHPEVYKVYIKPLRHCAEEYCRKFDIEDDGDKFPKEEIIKLAKELATAQNSFIERGDYEN